MKRRDDDGNCYFMELYSQKVSMQRRSVYVLFEKLSSLLVRFS